MVTRFEYKKLPKHWRYVLTKREVKQLILEIDADIRVVEFLGTGSKPSKITSGLYSAGNMDARASENQWSYRLRLWGLPETVFISDRKEISNYIVDDIKMFIDVCHQRTVNSMPSPLERRFTLRLVEGNLSPSFRTKKVEDFWETWAQDNPWWT